MPTVDQIVTNVGVRVNDTSTAMKTKILQGINWARRWLWMKRNWSWIPRTPSGIYTIAPAAYTSVTVTSGSTTATVDSNNAGQLQVSTDIGNSIYPFIVFGSDTDAFYRITARSYSAPTATLTITPAFQGTSASTETATIYFREYALPTDVSRLEVLINDLGQPLTPITISDHWYLRPKPQQSTGRPTNYASRAKATATILLDPIPDDNYPISIEYVPNMSEVVAGGTEASIVVPPRWHHAVEDLAMWFIRNLKDDSRENGSQGLARELLSEMIQEDVTMGGRRLPMIKREGMTVVSERDFTSDFSETRGWR